MKMTLTNNYHQTQTTINVTPGDVLSASRIRSIKKRLCPCSDCTCGDAFGRRGTQPQRNLDLDPHYDGDALVTSVIEY